MKKVYLFSVLAGLLLSACSSLSGYGNAASPNGKLIYFNATDQNGEQIGYAGGPVAGGMMMGQSLACASCHGADGHGGTHVMHMQVMDAPPIDYADLNSMMAEEANMTPQPDGYSIEDFRLAVVEGKHPDGDDLGTDMPRWRMTDQQLSDLFTYIKSLP